MEKLHAWPYIWLKFRNKLQHTHTHTHTRDGACGFTQKIVANALWFLFKLNIFFWMEMNGHEDSLWARWPDIAAWRSRPVPLGGNGAPFECSVQGRKCVSKRCTRLSVIRRSRPAAFRCCSRRKKIPQQPEAADDRPCRPWFRRDAQDAAIFSRLISHAACAQQKGKHN